MMKLITSNTVRELCGGISDMTIYRWLADPEMKFPRPTKLNRRRFWREAEILEWVEARTEPHGR